MGKCAFTYNGTVSKVYLNGALATYTKLVSFRQYTGSLYRRDSICHFPILFPGIIDRNKIYNKAIPDNRIGILNSLSKGMVKQK
jgi:hypothetical protein